MSLLSKLFPFFPKKKATNTVELPMAEYLDLIESVEKHKDMTANLEEELEEAEQAVADISHRLFEIDLENKNLKDLVGGVHVRDFQALHAYLRGGISFMHAEVAELRDQVTDLYEECDVALKDELGMQASFIQLKEKQDDLRATNKMLKKLVRLNVVVKSLSRTPNP